MRQFLSDFSGTLAKGLPLILKRKKNAPDNRTHLARCKLTASQEACGRGARTQPQACIIAGGLGGTRPNTGVQHHGGPTGGECIHLGIAGILRR